ncbi:MAG: Flavin-dependent oxidoreductase, F420-dependent methylene-tetrahydromethanopterin reductase [Frankiales bacterium]|nr:Flavin-dependent oxidoreductase, F420-dependent methylene-tetrahydromethanopterin reductase [Frankiales bacterium]
MAISNRAPLSVLDLVPVTAGSTPAQALRNTIDLAQQSEQFGYRRYWLAEHHLNPGVVGASPGVVMALVAGATNEIRIGSAGFQMGHRTALSVVEEAGLVEALHPGRVDLGLGRSAGKPGPTPAGVRSVSPARSTAARAPQQAPNGLVVPNKFSYRTMLGSPRLALQNQLLQLPGARSQPYAEQVADILSLLHGTYDYEGVHGQASPGQGADVQLWILGSSAGESAHVAAENSLRFAANYHIAPGAILEAVAAYRAAFQPSAELPEPYVAVSADVVVGETNAAAARLAAGYAPWVRSIRSGAGAIEYPTPAQAKRFTWTDEERELVADRLATQFVGSPRTVVARLEQLQEATGADELVITTITHDHADRVRSYELLAKAWNR